MSFKMFMTYDNYRTCKKVVEIIWTMLFKNAIYVAIAILGFALGYDGLNCRDIQYEQFSMQELMHVLLFLVYI